MNIQTLLLLAIKTVPYVDQIEAITWTDKTITLNWEGKELIFTITLQVFEVFNGTYIPTPLSNEFETSLRLNHQRHLIHSN